MQAFRVIGGEAAEITINPPSLTPGQPPVLRVEQDIPTLVTFPAFDPSAISHPVLLHIRGNYALITASGDLVITDPNLNQVARLAVNALPDARILVDEHDRLLLLTNPTTIYDHGVLGDRLEATSFTLIETMPTAKIMASVNLPANQVIEGIAPIWVDTDDDGNREIIVTVSNPNDGAQVVIYNESGERISAGPPIGRQFRWRHPIAAAEFGPDREIELVDVLTPHIGGSVEFYRQQNDALEVVAQLEGYTSHVIGTRNLDMAVAGELDGDGKIELLLPNQSRTELAAIRHSSEGAEVAWTLQIDGQMVTNLAAMYIPGDGIALALGRQDNVMRIWIP